jgi:hypothetical protein
MLSSARRTGHTHLDGHTFGADDQLRRRTALTEAGFQAVADRVEIEAPRGLHRAAP